jgi:hypothetical protein
LRLNYRFVNSADQRKIHVFLQRGIIIYGGIQIELKVVLRECGRTQDKKEQYQNGENFAAPV